MPPFEPFLIFTRKFNELGLRYMVTGSVAAIYYGEPRMTNDIDVVVSLRPEDVLRLERFSKLNRPGDKGVTSTSFTTSPASRQTSIWPASTPFTLGHLPAGTSLNSKATQSTSLLLNT